MGKDNELQITPRIEVFRKFDEDRSGTLSEDETAELPTGVLLLAFLAAEADQRPENRNLQSFFNSLRPLRLTEIVRVAQENGHLSLF